MLVCGPGDTSTSMSTMDEASSLEMKMAMAFVKCMSIPWKGFGPSYAVGCVRTEAFPKKNSRFTWDSSSLFTTCESEAKRCWVHSLSYSSHKTPESNMSHTELHPWPPGIVMLSCHAPVDSALQRVGARRHAPTSRKTPCHASQPGWAPLDRWVLARRRGASATGLGEYCRARSTPTAEKYPGTRS
jgi:hypothetical protein